MSRYQSNIDQDLMLDLASCFQRVWSKQTDSNSYYALIKEIHDLTIYFKNKGYAEFKLNYRENHKYFSELQELCNKTINHLGEANRTIYLAYGAAATRRRQQEQLGELFRVTADGLTPLNIEPQDDLDGAEREFKQAAEALARIQSLSEELIPGLQKLSHNPGSPEHKGLNMLGENVARLLKAAGIKPTIDKTGVYYQVLEKVCTYIGASQNIERLTRTCLQKPKP
jgi:hypothetical protein